MPKTTELFVIRKPGTYRLQIEMQVMLLYLNTAEYQVRQIVRFPPLEIPLIQPESTNLLSVRQAGSPSR